MTLRNVSTDRHTATVMVKLRLIEGRWTVDMNAGQGNLTGVLFCPGSDECEHAPLPNMSDLRQLLSVGDGACSGASIDLVPADPSSPVGGAMRK